MKTTPKGIEILTDTEQEGTQIREAKRIWSHLGYFLTPKGYIWNENKTKFCGGFLKNPHEVVGKRKGCTISELIKKIFPKE
jgi:hypothetical protein